MIIDIYGYIGSWPFWNIPKREPSDLLHLMDRYGIDRLAISSTEAILYRVETGNEAVAKAINESERFIGFGVLKPGKKEAMRKAIRALKDKGFAGIRLYPAFHKYPLGSAELMDPLLQACVREQMPLVVSLRMTMNWMLPKLEPEPVAGLTRRFPELRIIVAGPTRFELKALIGAMRACENLSVEISCLMTWGEVDLLIEEFGAKRVLFGSGFPLQYPSCARVKVDRLELSHEERASIFHLNAKTVLGLKS